jgi:hypothetical protein
MRGVSSVRDKALATCCLVTVALAAGCFHACHSRLYTMAVFKARARAKIRPISFPFPFGFGGGSVLRNTDCASMKAEVVFIVLLLGVREKSSLPTLLRTHFWSSPLPFESRTWIFSPSTSGRFFMWPFSGAGAIRTRDYLLGTFTNCLLQRAYLRASV